MGDKGHLIFLPAIVLLGWVSGILVNYLSDVLPINRRLVRPYCLNCNTPYELGNYFIWPRQCSACGKYRRLRTWLVEMVFVGISAFLWIRPPGRLGVFISLVLFVYFGLVTIIDLEHRMIMHVVSLVGAILFLVVGTWLHGLKTTFIGGVAGFGLMLFFYILGLGFLKVMSRWRRQEISADEALGFGDVSLSGVIGLLMGWPGIVGVLILGIFLAGLSSLIYLLVMLAKRKYHPGLAVPYGPFLVLATVMMLFYRESLI